MEEQTNTRKKERKPMSEVKVNPLRKEKIYVRFVPHNNGLPKNHVLFGGKADGTFDRFCAPVLRSSGTYKNILTNEEKEWLEEALDLDYGALSVYKSQNNFWDTFYVELTKEGLHLDLSNPSDYLKYAVLRANSESIAPSVEERIERPKLTYKYELVREGEEASMESAKMDATMSCYKEFAKIDNDIDTMRVLTELIDGRPYSQAEKPEFFRSRINMLIQNDPRGFLSQITDPMLHSKVIIRRAQELGKITKRGDYYYLASDKSPLCEMNETPTLSIAARFINQPAHQDIKFLLESEVDKNRK